MHSDFKNTPVMYGCHNCHQQGWIFPDSPDTTVLIIYPNCRHEIAYAYCPECDMYTNFLARSEVRRPPSWRCLECKTEHTLDSDFYNNPIRLIFEDEIPEDVQSKMKEQTTRKLVFILSALFLVIALIIKELFF